jgi:hypothetical protein
MHIDVATFESKHAERRRGFIHRGMYQLRGVANSVLGFETISQREATCNLFKIDRLFASAPQKFRRMRENLRIGKLDAHQ